MQAVELPVDPYSVLESGDILLIRRSFFEEAPLDREFLLDARLSRGQYHKNIAYRPNTGSISGFGKMERASVERLRSILGGYSRRVVDFAGELLPRYRSAWKLDYASLRPLEEAGRDLPLKKRNDLLHTDAFPTRPTNGGLILRFFTNVHPTKPRVWVVSDPFERIAPEHADAAGLRNAVSGAGVRRLKRGLRAVGLPVIVRSPYDEFMLRFHDYLKHNAEFQRACPKYEFVFPPGATWLVFTDIVPHSVLSGQLALEQTFLISQNSLASPERAPISILERIAATRLSLP